MAINFPSIRMVFSIQNKNLTQNRNLSEVYLYRRTYTHPRKRDASAVRRTPTIYAANRMSILRFCAVV